MQSSNVVSAVFDSQSEAQRAIQELRALGIDHNAISVIGKHDGNVSETTGSGQAVDNDDEPASFLSKAAAGSGIGALLGVAALAIPGVGPLAAAGAIAQSAIGGAAVTGTLVGAAAGGLSDVLTNHGVSKDDADYYGQHIDRGGIFVSVDTQRSGAPRDRIEDILHRAGGHSSGRTRMSSGSTTSTTSTSSY